MNGERIRQSLKTRDWARAGRRAAKLEVERESGRTREDFPGAVAAFLKQRVGEPATLRKYRRLMGYVRRFAEKSVISYVDEFQLERLDAYRETRLVSPLTWSKELQLLRQFFGFCQKRKWCEENPAKDMTMPPNPKPKERNPYTTEEITRIIAACETFGRNAYERARARAMILLMRFYGLRVSDVATLAKDRIRGDHIFLHALKNGAVLWLPVYSEVKQTLDCLPLPKGAGADCRYFFWTGAGSREGHIKTVDRTLQAVFQESGVPNAHAHRFRHTLTTEILVKGGTIEDAANILGDSPATIRKYYAKWSVAYQARTVEIMQRVHGTPVAHRKISA